VSIPVDIKIESTMGLTRKEYRQASTAAWRHTGNHWHREILPRHFLRRAIVTYRYQERGLAYERAKEKKWTHRRPLVWSGTLRGQLTSSRALLARRAGVSISVEGGRVLNLSGPNRRARAPDMRAEVSAISRTDERELAAVLEKELVKRLTATRRKRKVA